MLTFQLNLSFPSLKSNRYFSHSLYTSAETIDMYKTYCVFNGPKRHQLRPNGLIWHCRMAILFSWHSLLLSAAEYEELLDRYL